MVAVVLVVIVHPHQFGALLAYPLQTGGIAQHGHRARILIDLLSQTGQREDRTEWNVPSYRGTDADARWGGGVGVCMVANNRPNEYAHYLRSRQRKTVASRSW